MSSPPPVGVLLVLALLVAGCTGTNRAETPDTGGTDASAAPEAEAESGTDAAPDRLSGPYPDGALEPEVAAALQHLADGASTGLDTPSLETIADSGDVRLAWFVSDLLRFYQGTPGGDRLVGVFAELTGRGADPFTPWSDATNQLMAADVPSPPGYLEAKRALFTAIEPRWEPFFEEGAPVDWRHVSWGGVLPDDRPLGDDEPCARGCIPALDDPAVTPAADGQWYPGDAVVFGVVVDDEARAYPKNQVEVHEMVLDTLGGRRIAVPYCTLCGSAQAYFLDDVDGRNPVLRTSGLLIRSNKMMFDLETWSLIDTFTGEATTGPLAAGAVTLTPVSVVTSTWDDWRAAHPDTTILAEDGGIGRSYPLDPLGGRDDDGPIFPIGEPDPRLDVQAPILGFFTDEGRPVAIDVDTARSELAAGRTIVVEDRAVVADGGGLRIEGTTSHQAFWFAWSQFHPDTLLWPEDF